MAKKTTVIGSGFGGMAAALRLKAKGHKVILVEKHPDLGGRARVFKKDQFIYDGGPTVITAPYLFVELFSLFNKKISNYVKIVPLDLWYRFVFNDGETFDYSGNENSSYLLSTTFHVVPVTEQGPLFLRGQTIHHTNLIVPNPTRANQ